jgi:hypothetical protein
MEMRSALSEGIVAQRNLFDAVLRLSRREADGHKMGRLVARVATPARAAIVSVISA